MISNARFNRSTLYVERPIHQAQRFTFIKNEGEVAREVVLDVNSISHDTGCVKVVFYYIDDRYFYYSYCIFPYE